jgi:hypothetical protein
MPVKGLISTGIFLEKLSASNPRNWNYIFAVYVKD